MADVSFRDVRKSYGAHSVMHGVSIDIEDGEFVVLVGPSGCGKSTLLRMLAGLEEISDGTIAIAGEVVNDVAPKDRDIAMVFQNYALYPHMTVRENMAFSMRLGRVPAAVQADKIGRAAGILGLDALLDRYPGQLSGGQRQRVAMGRAIVRDPEVFLFDEPLSNLDAKLRVQMRGEIKALHQKLRTTTVYVTHDQVEAMTMADRIVVMRNGRIEQVGRPLDLYDRPANLFVATFIGSPAMNLLPGEVRDGVFHDDNGFHLRLAGAHALISGKVTLGIRPNKLRLGTEGTEVEVLMVEPTGEETQMQVRLGGTDLAILSHERLSHAPGERARLSLNAQDVHLFDSATEMRIG